MNTYRPFARGQCLYFEINQSKLGSFPTQVTANLLCLTSQKAWMLSANSDVSLPPKTSRNCGISILHILSYLKTVILHLNISNLLEGLQRTYINIETPISNTTLWVVCAAPWCVFTRTKNTHSTVAAENRTQEHFDKEGLGNHPHSNLHNSWNILYSLRSW